MDSRILWMLSCLIGSLLFSGCATTSKINAFKAFAETGNQYQSAISTVTDTAIQSNIDSNSLVLVNSRNQRMPLTQSDKIALEDDILDRNEQIVETTAAFLALKKQTALMSDYFSALGALASYDGASGLSTSAKGSIEALQGLVPALKNISIGQANMADFTEAFVPIAVAQFQSNALTAELKTNSHVIDKQLQLQGVFIEDLADQLKADKQMMINLQMDQLVNQPYSSAKALPKNWVERRRNLIMNSVNTSNAADQAVTLSKKMRTSFISLVEGRLDVGDQSLIASDLNRMSHLLQIITNES